MGESLLSEVTAQHVKFDKEEMWSFYLMSSFILEVLSRILDVYSTRYWSCVLPFCETSQTEV